MPPSHRRAIADIIACRTEALGGQQWCCNACGTTLRVFHSCRNRACPKCHGKQTQAWLEQRRAEMLPVPYFHVTVTVPEELRAVLRRHQIDGYGALMKTTTGAIIDLARDPLWVGGTVGVLAVLHTWTRAAHLPPPRSLPGHRRRPIQRRRHLASRRKDLPVPQAGARHPGPRPFPKTPSPGSARMPTCRAMSGGHPGSFISRRGARDKRPRSIISLATLSASPSPTTASSPSTPRPSPSATRTGRPIAIATRPCPATSSSGAFSSTSCQPASTRCAIMACGMPPAATMPAT